MISRRSLLKAGAVLAGSGVVTRWHAARAQDGFLELTAAPGTAKLYGDKPASLWLYNGMTPGPEIRAKRGERVRVRLINRLDQPTAIHWHGIRIDNAMDGVPDLTQKPVMPGETFEYDFVAPDAGTYWYHSHEHSWQQVDRGLYGPLIIEGDSEGIAPEHDLTLVADDWRLNQDGGFDAASEGAMMDWSHAGRLGNWLTINGVSEPVFELRTGATHRIRLINVANARILKFELEGARLAGLDGQAFAGGEQKLEGPINVGPAQRVDLLLTPEKSDEIVLREVSSTERLAAARFNVSGSGEAGSARLIANDLPMPDAGQATRHVLRMTGGAMGMMGSMTHNGMVMDRSTMMEKKQFWAFNEVANMAMEPIYAFKRGEHVVIEVHNHTAWPHAIHLHGHHFLILNQAEGEVMDFDGTWRDTFLIARDAKVTIGFVADNPGKWMLHCHMLEHAAAGMNAWYEVG